LENLKNEYLCNGKEQGNAKEVENWKRVYKLLGLVLIYLGIVEKVNDNGSKKKF
jgi:hypothetical protein